MGSAQYNYCCPAQSTLLLIIIMVSISLQPESGYVFLVVAGTAILNLYQMMKVGGARKKYGVPYPAMYSDKQPDFNCFQRAHQNLIEHLPLFLVLEILAGIQFPKYAASKKNIFSVFLSKLS